MKTLKILMTIVLVLGLCIIPVAALTADDLGDTVPSWAESAVDKALRYNLFDGIGDTIEVNASASRAQIASVIANCFGADQKADMRSFTDVTSGTWQYDSMAKAAYMQVFKGDGNGTMRPDDSITREEFFTVIARAFLIDPTDDYSLSDFSDADEISSWALSCVKALVQSGYVNGADGKINPKDNVTVAEAVQVVKNIVKSAFVSESNSYATYNGNTVITGKNVVLTKVTVDGDLYIGDGVNSLTLDGCTINGNIIVRGAASSKSASGASAGTNGFRTGLTVRTMAETDTSDTSASTGSASSGITMKNTVVQNDVVVYSANNEAVNITIKNDRIFSTRYGSGIEGDVVVETNIVITAPGVTIKNITVTAANISIELDGGEIVEFEIAEDAKGVTVEVSKDTHVENMVINADAVALAGEGSISNIDVNASNINIMVSDVESVTVAAGEAGVMAGSTVLKAGDTVSISGGKVAAETSTPETTSDSTESTSGNTTDTSGGSTSSILNPYIDRLYALESKYENLLASLFESTQASYTSGTSAAQLYSSVIAQVNAYETDCDSEYNSIVSEISGVISANSLDRSILDDIASYYSSVKSSLRSYYMQFVPAP